MLADVASLLACPVCAGPMQVGERAVSCERGHGYDIARQGYVNLLTGAAPTGDTADMIAARKRVHCAGIFAPVAAAVAARVAGARAIAELGAGSGYYLSSACGPDAVGLAVDSSVYAARACAKLPGRVGAIVADTWKRLPIGDGVLDAVLVVFSPRNPAEIARILTSGGAAIVVTPNEEHLAGLRARGGMLTVEPDKLHHLDRQFAEQFALVHRQRIRHEARLDPALAADVVAMGPAAFHGGARSYDAPVSAQIDVTLSVFRS